MVSGGLDSSLIAYLYNNIHNNKINTSSLGLRKKFNKWNELNLVKKLRTNQSNHHNVYLDGKKFVDEFYNIIYNLMNHLVEDCLPGIFQKYFKI